MSRHLNKASGGTAIKRGSGSIALDGQARTVTIVGRNPNDLGNGRILAMTKNNFAPLLRSLLFNVVGSVASSRAEWLGESDVVADEVCSNQGGLLK